MAGIFQAVDRGDVRGIAVEIRPPDAELHAVGIDPLPERFTRGQAFRAGGAIDADDIRRQPVAVAATQAAAAIAARRSCLIGA